MKAVLNTLRFAVYLMYRYYTRGRWGKSNPLFSAILAFAFNGTLHLMTLLLFTGAIKAGTKQGAEPLMYIFLGCVTALALLLWWAAPVKVIKQLQYSDKKVKKSYLWLVLYFVASFALLIFAILLSANRV